MPCAGERRLLSTCSQASRPFQHRVIGACVGKGHGRPGVRIGELSSVDKGALEFAFEALTRDTALEHLKLEVEWCPRRQRCLTCGEEYAVENFELHCPKCGGDRSTCISGTELDIAYLELEQPCAKS